MLHRIYQKTGMTPDDFFKKPSWVRAFIFASERTVIEQEGGK